MEAVHLPLSSQQLTASPWSVICLRAFDATYNFSVSYSFPSVSILDIPRRNYQIQTLVFLTVGPVLYRTHCCGLYASLAHHKPNRAVRDIIEHFISSLRFFCYFNLFMCLFPCIWNTRVCCGNTTADFNLFFKVLYFPTNFLFDLRENSIKFGYWNQATH